ncbi:hypothetical protein F8M41_025430 [Gigaspora margarita]|uniref:Uncharacterized protein n=1 Tax=Gigaspora margarita TaxID=4874 RepID=A0A8H4AA65_GIGMA|nr:hypothetical protein F8M41_025430 [Gigaspora margarita]
MPSKYFGSCSIHNCNNDATKFHKLTPTAYEKAKKKRTFEHFQYLKEGQELSFKHYLDIVEADRNKKKAKKMDIVVPVPVILHKYKESNTVIESASAKTKYKDFCMQVGDSNFFTQTNKENIDPTKTTFSKQVKILTSVLYKQCQNNVDLELDLLHF